MSLVNHVQWTTKLKTTKRKHATRKGKNNQLTFGQTHDKHAKHPQKLS